MNAIPCPTCGAVGTQICRRGGLHSPIWQANIPFPQGHDSRRSINEKKY